jgi:hypothetical protein
MRNLFIVVACIFAFVEVKAQDITGSWVGSITVGGTNLHLVFNIKKTADTSYSSTFDSPDQKAFGIPCDKTFLKKDSLFVGIATIGGGYTGVWDEKDGISGTYKQGGGKIALALKRISEADKADLGKDLVRPQTPKPPFPYYSEDVEYDNANKSLHYGATFTRPNGDGKYPAVIIISGSGTQDRDGTMMKGHKPYWVLADYLSRNGIAVLRVDDRGAGKSSLGDSINNKTSLDFSYDVETSLNYLGTRTDVDKKHLGLIGHSEGGMIAPMVAARRKDVNFIVLWGGPVVGGATILAEQYANSLVQQGVDTGAVNSFEKVHLQILKMFATSPDKKTFDTSAMKAFNTWEKAQPQKTLDALNVHGDMTPKILKLYNSMYEAPWIHYFVSYDPEKDLSKVKCAVLAIIGEKDTQVNAAENLAATKRILTAAGNKNVEVKALPGLNHLLQTAGTGQVDEYSEIQETMSPMAMKIISDWIKLQTK